MMRFCTKLPYYRFNNSNLTIVHFKQGSGEFVVGNKSFKIGAEKFIVLNPGVDWEFINHKLDYIDVLSMVVSDTFQEQFSHYTKASPTKLLDDPQKRDCEKPYFIEQAFRAENYRSGRSLEAIYALSNHKKYALKCADEHCIEVLKALYADQKKGYDLASRIEAKKSSTKMETLKRLLIVNEYINDNLEKDISFNELSQVSALSRFHLYSSFKNVFGQTPHQYINSLKMSRAKSYLEKGQFSIGEIADFLGYGDISVFGKVFKKRYGHCPSHFRTDS